jgi:transketolase
MANTIPCRKVFTDTLLTLAQEDKDIVVVTSDARGSVTLDEFASELPAQLVEVGIAEQNAVGIAAGLALCGKKVFVCGPACFYVARSLEQMKVDLAYTNVPVKVIGVSGGVSYGALGFSHHSLHDIATLRTLPNMHIFLPSDLPQMRRLVHMLVDYPHPVYVRIGRGAVPNIYHGKPRLIIGRANLLVRGDDVTLIGTGETTYNCIMAARILRKRNIRARVIDMHTIKPLDASIIRHAMRETRGIVTVEEHSKYGGLGAAVAEVMAQGRPRVPLRIVGFPDEELIHGTQAEIFQHYGLDAKGIVRAVGMALRKYKDKPTDVPVEEEEI